MKRIVVALLLFTATADADIQQRTYKGVSGVSYNESDKAPSCGNSVRDFLKKTTEAMRTVTVSADAISVNTGAPQKITDSDADSVTAMTIKADPLLDAPDRKVVLSISVNRGANGDYFLTVTRIVASGDSLCGDSCSKSLD